MSFCLLLEGALREKAFERFSEVFLVFHSYSFRFQNVDCFMLLFFLASALQLNLKTLHYLEFEGLEEEGLLVLPDLAKGLGNFVFLNPFRLSFSW